MATKLEILTSIGTAQQSDPFYLMVSEASVKTYVKQGLVEVNRDITDEDFKVAARLTAAGIEYVNNNNNLPEISTTSITPTAQKEPTVSNTFEIVSNVPVPVSKRGAGLCGRKCKYPFDALEVGQMFFVPASDAQPEPWKGMVGVVSGANKRYATAGNSTKINRKGEEVPTLVYTRRFVLRKYVKDGVEGAGIWREM